MIVVTGGAGFIGSNLAAELDQRGHSGIGDKCRNIAKRSFSDFVAPGDLKAFLTTATRADAVLCLVAISSMTAVDGDRVARNSFGVSKRLWDQEYPAPSSISSWRSGTR